MCIVNNAIMIKNSFPKINLVVNQFNLIFKCLNFIYWNYLNIKIIVWKVNKNYGFNLNVFETFMKKERTLLRDISDETRFVRDFRIHMKLYARSLSIQA